MDFLLDTHVFLWTISNVGKEKIARDVREKIEDDSSSPKFIMTKRGVGYYFRRI